MAFLVRHSYYLWILFCLVAIPAVHGADSDDGRSLALKFRKNVIRISDPEEGFGIIVGESDGHLFVLTAHHVISDDKEKLYESVTVQTHHKPDQDITADTVELNALVEKIDGKEFSAKDFDIGILRIPKPDHFRWEKDLTAMARDHAVGMKAWYVGRSQEWEVPAEPGIIDNQDISKGRRIELSMSVREGSSGAPIFSKYGFFGMLRAENASDKGAKGVAVDFIRDACKRNSVPWNLASAPFPNKTMYRAKRAYDFNMYGEALKLFEPQAENGNLIAMEYTALIYFKHDRDTRDYERAAYWARRAAEKDSAGGMMILFMIHAIGPGGMEKDYSSAFYWLKKAADKDFPEAVYTLGQAYQLGLFGQKPDRRKAISYFHKACDLGYPTASDRLLELGESPCE